MAEPPSTDGPPSFEDPFRGDDVEQRVYGTILQLRDPTTAGAVADRAECDPKTARKYLDWFTELGLVTRHGGRPVTYERNDAYFEWRRVDRLAAEHTAPELRDRVRELTVRIEGYEQSYDARTPAAVDALAAATDDRTVDDVYRDLADWETARDERARTERARQRRTDRAGEQASG